MDLIEKSLRNSIPQIIDRIMITNKLSGSMLANELEVSEQAIWKYKSGKCMPSLCKIAYLVKKYGVPFDEFIGMGETYE